MNTMIPAPDEGQTYVVLDTETTGISHKNGHRIVEIACVEMINRRLTGRSYHVYINPEREVDEGAVKVHGLDNEFLEGKPLFKAIADEFLAFVKGAELIIHNATFDLGFLNAELKRLGKKAGVMDDYCPRVTDTLKMARQLHAGKNDLDTLCKRYRIDNTNRTKHGALIDCELLAQVYLAMTGGQTALGMIDPQGGAIQLDVDAPLTIKLDVQVS